VKADANVRHRGGGGSRAQGAGAWSESATLLGIDALSQAAAPWGMNFVQLSPGGLRADYAVASTLRVNLSYAAYSGAVALHGRVPAGTCAITVPASRGSSAPGWGPGGPLPSISRAGSKVSIYVPRGAELFAVVVEEALLDEEVRARLGKSLRSLARGAGLRFRNEQARRRLLDQWRVLLGIAAVSSTTPPDPREGARLFERVVLESFLLASVPAAVEERSPAHVRLAYRTELLMRERLGERVRLAHVARELGTSVRSVQLSFQEAFGMPPSAYHAALRLNGARRALRAGGEGPARVYEVAQRWGFHHAGRFSIAYRRMFGESPRATVRAVRLEKAAERGASPLSLRFVWRTRGAATRGRPVDGLSGG